MLSSRLLPLLLLGFVSLATALPRQASGADQYHSPRQYYSAWQKHPDRGYHYRRLYYKPTPSYVGYKHQYVLYYQSKPRHVYFYNPYKGVYWGRCAIHHEGQYSVLPPKHRKARLTDIPEAAFPPPAQPPLLPEASDGVLLDLPPDDLPAGLPSDF